MNISLPRPGDVDKQTDLIPAGDTFTATEAAVQNLLHPKFGPPRIRKIEEQGEEMPLILPRHISNSLRGPEVGARPDPVGSSAVQVLKRIPELSEPQPDTETKPAETEAVDIPPRARTRATKAG